MSSAFYPLGMNSYNNRLPQGGYETWKGRGVYGNPVGITSGNMRPLTNLDPANDAVYKAGLPRPLKQYRRGISIPIPIPKTDNFESAVETYYYSNREVKSSVQDRMVAQLMDQPGRFIVKENKVSDGLSTTNKLNKDCKTCEGVGIVSGWYPINNLTEKPQPNVTNPLLCCNQQRKAIKRVLPASTILKKNYYTTNYQYLFNRCQTFEQRSFNFVKGVKDPNVFKNYPDVTAAEIALSKPGDPLSYLNYYVANCNPNSEITTAVNREIINKIGYILVSENIITAEQYKQFQLLKIITIQSLFDFLKSLPEEPSNKAIALSLEILYNPYNGALIQGPSNPRGCATVEYKPNNPQFAQQGAVSSSTRMLKLNVTTIEKNAASIKQRLTPNIATSITQGIYPFVPYIYKTKVSPCNPGLYIKDGNPRTCFRNNNDNANNNLDPVATFNNQVNQLADLT